LPVEGFDCMIFCHCSGSLQSTGGSATTNTERREMRGDGRCERACERGERARGFMAHVLDASHRLPLFPTRAAS
jgi:hypothetical protein